MIARMWEVKGHAETLDDLLTWVDEIALPAVESEAGLSHSQVYRSQDRVVVICHWTDQPRDLPEPPETLVARPPHAWNFTPVERRS